MCEDECVRMSMQAKRRPFDAGGAGEGNPFDLASLPLPCTHVWNTSVEVSMV